MKPLLLKTKPVLSNNHETFSPKINNVEASRYKKQTIKY